MSRWTGLSSGDLWKLLDDVPRHIRLDVVQLSLDMAGIVDQSGAADATNAFISLLRGDLIGAAISGASIFPVGDLAKVAKFERYSRSLRTLVSIALRRPKLAWALRDPMRKLNRLLNSIRSFMGDAKLFSQMVMHIDTMKRAVSRYLDKVVMIERFGVERVARKAGRSADQYLGHGGTKVTVNSVVDTLTNARNSTQKKVADEADEMLEILALSDRWTVTAGIHPSSSDATRHITLLVDGFNGQFHIRVDKRGHLFGITQGVKGSPLSTVPRRNH